MKLALKISICFLLGVLIFSYCKKSSVPDTSNTQPYRSVTITFEGDMSNSMFQIHNRGYQYVQYSPNQSKSNYVYSALKGDTVYVIPSSATFTLTETMTATNGILLSPIVQVPILSQNGFYCFILS